MKKIAIVIAVLILAKAGFSQNDDTKKFRFGLKIAPAINWLKPDDTKKYATNGVTLGFNWGLTGEYNISKNFAIISGVEVFHESGKIEFINEVQPVHYYMTEGYEIIETKEQGGIYVPQDTTGFKMALASRKYKSSYVVVPIGIKMKTNQIGYLTYFGEFGINLAFKTGSKINDEAIVVDNNASDEIKTKLNNPEDIIIKNEMQPLRTQLKIGLGAEYEISEGTAIVAGLHYNLGFTNVVKTESNSLLTDLNQQVKQKFTAHGILLSIAVLF